MILRITWSARREHCIEIMSSNRISMSSSNKIGPWEANLWASPKREAKRWRKRARPRGGRPPKRRVSPILRQSRARIFNCRSWRKNWRKQKLIWGLENWMKNKSTKARTLQVKKNKVNSLASRNKAYLQIIKSIRTIWLSSQGKLTIDF